MSASQKIQDIEEISSIRPVKGSTLRLVFERTAQIPFNMIHVANTDNEIIFSSESRMAVVKFLKEN